MRRRGEPWRRRERVPTPSVVKPSAENWNSGRGRGRFYVLLVAREGPGPRKGRGVPEGTLVPSLRALRARLWRVQSAAGADERRALWRAAGVAARGGWEPAGWEQTAEAGCRGEGGIVAARIRAEAVGRRCTATGARFGTRGVVTSWRRPDRTSGAMGTAPPACGHASESTPLESAGLRVCVKRSSLAQQDEAWGLQQ